MATTPSGLAGTAPMPSGGVAAILPLSLLESLRSHDRPPEVLEDEDLAASLPRRLGLSDVIDSQIRRYTEARRKGRAVPAGEVVDLLRLVIRRPDDEPIFDHAGRELTDRFISGREGRRARFARLLPQRLRRAVLRRALGRLARRAAAGAPVSVEANPIIVRIEGCLTARIDPGGVACSLYTSAFREMASRYLGHEAHVAHTRCETRGADSCDWVLRS